MLFCLFHNIKRLPCYDNYRLLTKHIHKLKTDYGLILYGQCFKCTGKKVH